MDFEFTPGKFEKLRVVKGFHFGPLQMDMRLNQVIEFDGTALKIGDRLESKPPIPMAMMSAWRAGWAVLEVEGQLTTAEPVYKTAAVQVRPAQTVGNERGAAVYLDSVTEDDRVVGTVKGTSTMRDSALKKANAAFNVATDAPVAIVQAVDTQPLEVTYPGVGDTPPLAKKYPTFQDDSSGQGGSMIKTATHQKINMGGDTSQASTGVAVGKIASSTVQKTVVTEDTQIDDDIELSDEAAPVKVQKIARASSEGVTVATVSPAVKKIVITDSTAAAIETNRLRNEPPPKAKFVTVRAEESQGEDIKAVGPKGATGDVSEVRSGDNLEALLPGAASSGVPAAGVAGEGFSWNNKVGFWGNRVKEAVAKYGDNPGIIAKIIEIEGPTIGKHIKAAMAARK